MRKGKSVGTGNRPVTKFAALMDIPMAHLIVIIFPFSAAEDDAIVDACKKLTIACVQLARLLRKHVMSVCFKFCCLQADSAASAPVILAIDRLEFDVVRKTKKWVLTHIFDLSRSNRLIDCDKRAMVSSTSRMPQLSCILLKTKAVQQKTREIV